MAQPYRDSFLGADLPEVVPGREGLEVDGPVAYVARGPENAPEMRPSSGLCVDEGRHSTKTYPDTEFAQKLPPSTVSSEPNGVPEYAPVAAPNHYTMAHAPASVNHRPESTVGSPAYKIENWPPEKRFWSRKKKWIAAVIAFVLLAVILGVTLGLVLGGESEDSGDRDSGTSQSAQPSHGNGPSATSNIMNTAFGTPTDFPLASATASSSACRDTFCPPILAAQAPTEDDERFLLIGMGKDGSYFSRESDGEEWLSDWESIGGMWLSEPSVVSPRNDRIDVFGVWDDDLSVKQKTWRRGSWGNEWASVGGVVHSALSVCSDREGNIRMFTTNQADRMAWKSFDNGQWSGYSVHKTGALSSAIKVICTGSMRLDIMAFGRTTDDPSDQLMLKRSNGTSMEFKAWRPHGGQYQGDPTGIGLGPNRTDFFGVGLDGRLYHGSWRDLSEDSFSTSDGAQSIGGNFISVPALISLDDDWIDVFVVATDGRLRHRALRGDDWSDEWEDFGGFFHSAPTVVKLKNRGIAVFGIGPDDEVIHGVWKVDDDGNFSGGQWFVDGGSFSRDTYRLGKKV